MVKLVLPRHRLTIGRVVRVTYCYRLKEILNKFVGNSVNVKCVGKTDDWLRWKPTDESPTSNVSLHTVACGRSGGQYI